MREEVRLFDGDGGDVELNCEPTHLAVSSYDDDFHAEVLVVDVVVVQGYSWAWPP